MRIGPFISLISSTFGVPENTVVVVARALREASWLSSGARGVNAPPMTARDAARLSLALLSGESPGHVIKKFAFIRALQTKEVYQDDGIISQRDLGGDHILEDVVTLLFDVYSDAERIERHSELHWFGRLGPFFSLSVDSSRRTAVVKLPGQTAEYLDLIGAAELDELYQVQPLTLEVLHRRSELEERSIPSDASTSVVAGHGMRVIRTITQEEFQTIAFGLFDLQPE